MGKILRLIYVSRASFIDNEGPDRDNELDSNVVEILATAREFNREARISGALYFADGFFFQCLEGKASVVYPLLERIKQDSRHTDLKVSYCKSVRRRLFKEWTMKYVPVAKEVIEVMQTKGYPDFSPVNFDESDINQIMQLFVKLEDANYNDNTDSTQRSKAAWWQRLFGRSTAAS